MNLNIHTTKPIILCYKIDSNYYLANQIALQIKCIRFLKINNVCKMLCQIIKIK